MTQMETGSRSYLLTNPARRPTLASTGWARGLASSPTRCRRIGGAAHRGDARLYRNAAPSRDHRRPRRATAGLCRRGAVILLEDYRCATLRDHPRADLSIQTTRCCRDTSRAPTRLSATPVSRRRASQEFLSLFANAIETAREQAQVDLFFRDAGKSIDGVRPRSGRDRGFATGAPRVEREKPAHVAVTYLRASQPFLIGMASLLGVNTYLTPTPPRKSRGLTRAHRGHAFVAHLPSLDPRLEAGAPAVFAGLSHDSRSRPCARHRVNLDGGGSSHRPAIASRRSIGPSAVPAKDNERIPLSFTDPSSKILAGRQILPTRRWSSRRIDRGPLKPGKYLFSLVVTDDLGMQSAAATLPRGQNVPGVKLSGRRSCPSTEHQSQSRRLHNRRDQDYTWSVKQNADPVTVLVPGATVDTRADIQFRP